MAKITERDLQKQIKTMPWERLTKIYMETRSSRIKKMIEKEARACGYRMKGFIAAHVLRHFENAGGR